MKIRLPTTTKRQSTSHQTHTTKHRKFTLTPNDPSLQNKTADVVIQQHSRKLLMMDILMSETSWAHKKWNKIASDIKLFFYPSTIRNICLLVDRLILLKSANTVPVYELYNAREKAVNHNFTIYLCESSYISSVT